jgi:hypothetical protein
LTGRQKDDARRQARRTEWEQYQKEEVRRRAAAHARESFEKFSQSRIYRAAMVLERVYKYVFIGAGLVMALGPVVMRMVEEPVQEEEFSVFSLIVPFIIGAAFLYGIWYFLFNLDE